MLRPDGAWMAAGFAIECCLKAAIMKKEGLNRWPDRDRDPDLWTHDLRVLFKRLGVEPLTFDPRNPVAPALKMCLEWRREHGYSIGKVPQRLARDICEAAFDRMASRPVSPQYLKAGADYLEALRSLGLNPNFLGWGWEIAAERWILVLVTSIIDAGGPLALNKLLFQAYNAEATPKEISPFIVRVFSSAIVQSDFYILGKKGLTVSTVNGKKRDPIKVENVQRTFFGIELEQINSYQNLPNKKLKYHERRQAWQKFKNNVERLAA